MWCSRCSSCRVLLLLGVQLKYVRSVYSYNIGQLTARPAYQARERATSAVARRGLQAEGVQALPALQRVTCVRVYNFGRTLAVPGTRLYEEHPDMSGADTYDQVPVYAAGTEDAEDKV